jgi:invasion protein IalB
MRATGWSRTVRMVVGAVVALGLASGARADSTIRGTFGDWTLRCETPAGADREQCVLVQSVAAEDRDQVQLAVLVLKTPRGGYFLRVVVPLGVILPSGLGLKIDDTDIGRTGFLRCLANGCMAEVAMEDALLNRFKSGDHALFFVFMAPEDGVGFPIRLAGLADGLAKLP